MNWSNAVIEGNVIKNVLPGSSNNSRGILASGVHNPTMRNNVKVLAQHDIIRGKEDKIGNRYFDATGKLTRIQFTQLLNQALYEK